MTDKDYEIADVLAAVAKESGHTPSQVAINWTINRDHNVSVFPLIGCRTVEQLKDNLGALEFTLTKEQLKKLDDVSNSDTGFPHNFLGGTDYQSSRWLRFGSGINIV